MFETFRKEHHVKLVVMGWLMLASGLLTAQGQEVVFEDLFRGKLDPGWVWVREHPGAWRVTERGLEVRVEPGNMWGSANNARNVLVRPAPEPTNGTIEISVTVENTPTNQYEQVDLVWYYDDSHMVKLGQELVDGKLSIVMGREEKDKTRTIAIIPITATRLDLRFEVTGTEISGYFRAAGDQQWEHAGKCSVPAPPGQPPRISLQFYQGPTDVEHWARVTNVRIARRT